MDFGRERREGMYGDNHHARRDRMGGEEFGRPMGDGMRGEFGERPMREGYGAQFGGPGSYPQDTYTQGERRGGYAGDAYGGERRFEQGFDRPFDGRSGRGEELKNEENKGFFGKMKDKLTGHGDGSSSSSDEESERRRRDRGERRQEGFMGMGQEPGLLGRVEQTFERREGGYPQQQVYGGARIPGQQEGLVERVEEMFEGNRPGGGYERREYRERF